MDTKQKLEDYTEAEFLEFVGYFFETETDEEPEIDEDDDAAHDAFDAHVDSLVNHFRKITEHPSGSDLIFYPEKDREDSPEGILNEVKKWREANGRPGFKPA